MSILHPEVQNAANRLILLSKEQGINIVIINTFRTEALQSAIYSQGRKSLDYVNKLRQKAELDLITEKDNKWATNAKQAKLSYHGYGLAFDIAIIKEDSTVETINKKIDWSSDSVLPWLTVGRLSKQINGLEWGGTFSASPDLSHYQMTFGLTITDLLNGIEP